MIRPGGVLHLQVAEGDGEAWQYADRMDLPRLFVYHREPELTRHLGAVGFTVYQVNREKARRDWLILRARRTP